MAFCGLPVVEGEISATAPERGDAAPSEDEEGGGCSGCPVFAEGGVDDNEEDGEGGGCPVFVGGGVDNADVEGVGVSVKVEGEGEI